MSQTIHIVSVVRDFSMYGKCVADNPWCRDFHRVYYDNREENLPIPARYNHFIDSHPEEGWIIFCHEDWQLLCDIRPILETCDPGCLYGPVGQYVEMCEHADFESISGYVIQSRKDGSHAKEIIGMIDAGIVDTFDCQCIIVHTSLLRKYGLRFDPHFAFDLYTEDFCAMAHSRYGIASRTLEFPCQHYSEGVAGERFHARLDDIKAKYKDAPKRYGLTVGRLNTFGGDPTKPIYMKRRTLMSRIRYKLKK
ncbi:MAG: hypothetical protein IJ652_07510 [Bacteroidales bacterium]|nr:hypothetical protein [Bacteroidales bacterium]